MALRAESQDVADQVAASATLDDEKVVRKTVLRAGATIAPPVSVESSVDATTFAGVATTATTVTVDADIMSIHAAA